MITNKYVSLLDRVLAKAMEVRSTGKVYQSKLLGRGDISYDKSLRQSWESTARFALAQLGEVGEIHLASFNEKRLYSTSDETMDIREGIIREVRELVVEGYMSSLRQSLSLDIYSNNLDAAVELLNSGYLHAAGTIAGIVLEARIRDIAETLDLYQEKDTLSKMAGKLRQHDYIDKPTKKHIDSLADIRNMSAHGKDELTQEDVERIIRDIPSLLSGSLSLDRV